MKTKVLLFAVAIALATACATTIAPAPVVAPTPVAVPAPVPHHDYAVVRTFFATDRNRNAGADPNSAFGANRDQLRYGVAHVSIPRSHRMGTVERPWPLVGRENPEKHVVVLDADVQSRAQFFAGLSARVRASQGGSALVFVHGYNVSFADAARRTAQMAYNLNFDGAPVFYSWPSRGTILGYVVDGQSIAWSQANMETFLREFFARSEAQSVYLIAHSMGSRALTGAIANVARDNPSIRPRLKEIVLAAPDIDARIFRDSVVPALVATGAPITLYASSDDTALAVAKRLFAGAPRAGQSGADLVVMPGIETIDATGLDAGFLGHSYFGDHRTVLSDMFYLFQNRRPDARAGLRRVSGQAVPHWAFRE